MRALPSPPGAGLRRLCGAAAFCAGLFLGSAAAAQLTVPPETVERRVAPGGGFEWIARYDAEVREGALWLRVNLHLVPGPGLTWADLERPADAWRMAIREAWNDRLAMELPDGERLGVRVEVSFAGPRYHHEVVVHRGGRRTDSLHWGITDSPWLVAHEFGHLLGAFDDYRGGATGEVGRVDDRGSVMAAGPRGGASARARHLEGVRAWFAAKTGTNARIVAVEQNENASGNRGGEVEAGLAMNSGAGGDEERGRR